MQSLRTKRVQRAQVLNKMSDARARCDDALERALNAQSAEVYSANLDRAIRAASDYQTWFKVWEVVK